MGSLAPCHAHIDHITYQFEFGNGPTTSCHGLTGSHSSFVDSIRQSLEDMLAALI